jgi:hypothetical protein
MPDPSIVNCGRCQQPNWVPAGWEARRLQCTHCGVGLASRPRRRRRSGAVTLASETMDAFMGAVMLVGIASFYRPAFPMLADIDARITTLIESTRDVPRSIVPASGPSVPPAPASKAPGSTANALPVSRPAEPLPVVPPPPMRQAAVLPATVPISEGIVSASKPRDRIVPLQIRAAAGGNYFVKLVNVADERDVIELFVRGGSTVKANMPLGTYRLRFASGQSWYGETLRFGSPTSYWAANETLTFRRDRNEPRPVSIELAEQKGGGMRVAPLDAARF